ncbi:hypothetical protein L1887_47040 [Cichorium endivia]|nr:hypothetical protein L1887_47040 [Cichorium endivia]
MGFNKKLIVAGLAVGITALMLYKASKKHQQPHHLAPAPAQHSAMSSSNHSHAASLGGAALGGAAVAAAGAAYAHHNAAAAPPPTSTRSTRLPTSRASPTTSPARARSRSAPTRGSCPPYLAQDLVKLALFDVMFLLDDSASMRSEGTRRRDALAGILKRAADAAARFDPDGMEVAWMNAPVHQRIHNVQEADQLTSRCAYDGRSTPMGSSLESKLLEPLVLQPAQQGRLAKPALVLVITDGRPTGSGEANQKIVRVLQHAKRTLAATRYGEDAISFQIAAVGNDREAQEWLDSIDNDPDVGDLVDVCSDIQVESRQVKASTGVELTQELYCLKLLLGPIDTSYDASDENEKISSWNRSAKRRREKKAQAKAHKEAAFRAQMDAFRRDRDAALQGATPVPSAGGALPPQVVDDGLSGYSHQPGYPQQPQQGAYPPAAAGYPQQPGGYPQQGGGYPQPQQAGGYPQPGGGYAQPQQSGYPQPGSAYPQPGSGYPQAGGGYPQPGGGGYAAPGYQPYGSGPSSAPPPYPDAYGSRDIPAAGNSSYAPPPGSGGFVPGAGGFAMPNPHVGGAPPSDSQHQQQPIGFPQPKPVARCASCSAIRSASSLACQSSVFFRSSPCATADVCCSLVASRASMLARFEASVAARVDCDSRLNCVSVDVSSPNMRRSRLRSSPSDERARLAAGASASRDGARSGERERRGRASLDEACASSATGDTARLERGDVLGPAVGAEIDGDPMGLPAAGSVGAVCHDVNSLLSRASKHGSKHDERHDT